MPSHFPIWDHPVVAIDLDDTLSEFDGYKGWRHIGPPRPYAQEFVNLFRSHGWVTFLWTARLEDGLLREWLHEHKFIYNGAPAFNYINKSPINLHINCNPSKPIADLYIDNATYPFCGHPVPLREVAEELIRRGILDGSGMGKASHTMRHAEEGRPST